MQLWNKSYIYIHYKNLCTTGQHFQTAPSINIKWDSQYYRTYIYVLIIQFIYLYILD